MPASRLRFVPVVAVTALIAGTATALAEAERPGDQSAARADRAAASSTAPAVRSLLGRSAFSVTGNFLPGQHGGSDLHLPPTRQNVDLVSKLEMSTPAGLRTPATAGQPVLAGQIADVAVYKNFAYLNSWNEPTCRRGGTFIVDISNPRRPVQTGFIPAIPGRYHGEGAHVITLDTPAFRGDVLAVNNEPFSELDPATGEPCVADLFNNGGFDLYDVSNPRAPRTLIQGAGDMVDPAGNPLPSARSAHSVFMWQGHDRRAYVVAVDNVELTDVDIFEITDPRRPRLVGEFDFVAVAEAQGVDIIDEGGLGGAADIFLHDMVVKRIGNRFVMMADYWDAGYLTFDVTNPARPTYIADSTFDGPDPLTGQEPQEGNAHQGEFSYDNRYILAADEDFSPFRPGTFEITTGPNAGEYPAVAVGGAASPAFLPPDGTLNGPTVYGGYGCDASDPIPPRATAGLPPLEENEEAIVVLQRGPSQDPNNPEPACFPGEKAENGIEAGYDAVLLTNHHVGEAGGVFCGSGDFPPSPPIVAICTTHAALHTIFGEPVDTTVPYPPGHGPPLGDLGEKVEANSVFDGWGYTHILRARTTPTGGKQVMERIDSYAIEESLNPNYAFGYGDLSVHEFATDPTEYVAYSSYYSGGMRVFTFGEGGLTEQGKFIDQGGNNFWGVEQFTLGNQRYFAGSDRDFGLYIFRYTGPGAAVRPVCTDTVVMVPFRGSARVPLPCSDANRNPLSRSIVSGPSAGRVSGNASSGAVTYEHTGGSLGRDSLTFKANDGTMDSPVARVTLVIVPREGGACFNRFVGTAGKDHLVGSPFGDDLRGRAGNDDVQGLHGDDCLRGDRGRDDLRGDSGRDRISGGTGKDRVFGESGNDRLFGNGGDDHVNGVSGHDRGDGGGGEDLMDGGSNNDRFAGGAGDDRIRGGPGRDRLSGGSGDDRLEAGDARNRLSGGSGDDRLLAANDKVDRIRCGRGDDRVRADAIDRVARDCETVRRTVTVRD